MYSYTTGPTGGLMPELPFIVLDEVTEKANGAELAAGEGTLASVEREDKEALIGSPLYSSVATASPLSTTSTISNTSTSSSFSRLSHTSSSSSSSASSALVSPTNSASLPPSASTSPTLTTTTLPPLHHYFAHAGALIKLIGGRKKSKLLFRSTKIQVFKDINLIRLRDGCSGVSMDLWFPSERRVVGRSQRHVAEVKGYLQRWRWMGVLAVVVKTFMQQQLLNSGYSGLGSYGVLLMIVRYLQVDRERRLAQHDRTKETEASVADVDHAAQNEDEDEGDIDSPDTSFAASTATDSGGEPNVGRVLCGFFRFWAEFDYVNRGVDVCGEGCFVDKPQIKYSQRKSTRMGPNCVGGADSDDDEQHTTQSGQDAAADDMTSDAALSGTGAARPVLPSERLSLVIVDPCDTTNHIVCHHKALRNMIAAFIQAVAVLDPTGAPAVPATDVRQLAELEDMLPAVAHTPSAVSAASSISSSAVASTVGSTTSTAPASPLTSKPTSASATPASTTRTSPTLAPSTTSPLTTAPPPKLTFGQPQRSRFHRLIDFNQARLGPSMKLCPSPACQFPDGTSTQCPVQNKVCYTCGHTFVKQSGTAANTPAMHVQLKQTGVHGHEGKSNSNRRGRGKGHKPQLSHSTPTAPVHLQPSFAAQQVSSTYSPPLNKVMANGTIANTNGMKFVHPPPAGSPANKPLVTPMTPAAAVGGFVYINSPPLSMAVAVPGTPPPFSLSMPVSPYYPSSLPPPGAGGAAYYGGYDPSFSYAAYTQPPAMQANGLGGAGKRFNGQRGGRGGGGGMAGNRSYGAAMMQQPAYYDPTVAASAPYMASPSYYSPSPQLPAQSAYYVSAAVPHTMAAGRY